MQAPFGSEAYGCLAPTRSFSARASCDVPGSTSRNNSCEMWGPRSSSSSAGTPSHPTHASSGSRSSCDIMRGGSNGGGACTAAGASTSSNGSLFGCGSLMARVNGEAWQAGEGAGAGAAAAQAAEA
eukprot:756347-Pelagomonas_calceolata.AAC.2